MAMIINTTEIEVISVVIVVELDASSGILRSALLIMMKESRAPKAKSAPRINLQSKSIWRRREKLISPEMRERDPVRRTDIVETQQKKKVQRNTYNIIIFEI